MSKKSLKIALILVTILSLISTFSFATDTSTDAANTPVTTSEDTATDATTTTSDETVVTTDDSTSTESEDITASQQASQNHDMRLIGDSITISAEETVNGNVFVIANEVTINGQIGGDLFVMANNLNIDGGQIYGNVFAIANYFKLNGLMYDCYANCITFDMPYDAFAYRDVKVNCVNATIEGIVGKNLEINASGTVSLKNEALVYGDMNYSSPKELNIIAVDKDGNTVDAKTIDKIVTGTVNYESSINILGYAISALTALIYALVIWFLASKLAPKFYERVTTMGPKKMLLALVVGLVALIVVPVVAGLLVFTVVGIPVALALLGLYALAISVAMATAVISLAGKLGSKVKVLGKFNNLFAVIITALVIWALGLIPYAGIIITMLFGLFGFGVFVSGLKKEKAQKVSE